MICPQLLIYDQIIKLFYIVRIGDAPRQFTQLFLQNNKKITAAKLFARSINPGYSSDQIEQRSATVTRSFEFKLEE